MTDTIAVMDAEGIGQAVLVGFCTSAWTALLMASLHPGRVLGVVSIATWAPFLTPPLPWRAVYDFNQAHDTDEGWATSPLGSDPSAPLGPSAAAPGPGR